MSAQLELTWKERRAGDLQSPRRFLDYVVDGVSLHDRHGADDISCLGWLPPAEDEQAAQRLTGRVEPDVEDRVALWVCAECGDILCGALTAHIVREGDQVVWRNFAVSWHDHVAGRWTHDVGPFGTWDEIRFDAAQYQRTITGRPPSPAPSPRRRDAMRGVCGRLLRRG